MGNLRAQCITSEEATQSSQDHIPQNFLEKFYQNIYSTSTFKIFMDNKLVVTFSKTAFLFGLLVWFYVIAMQIAHPESVSWTFTYWLRIRMDFVGELAFVISLIGFLIWQFVTLKK